MRENVEVQPADARVGKAERRQRAEESGSSGCRSPDSPSRNVAHLGRPASASVNLARSLVTGRITFSTRPLALDAHLKVRMQAVLSPPAQLGITFVYGTPPQSEAFSWPIASSS